MEIYEKIKLARLKKEETQEQIANILNTTREYVWRYENGKVQIPAERVKALCKHWNISADWIFDLQDMPKEL